MKKILIILCLSFFTSAWAESVSRITLERDINLENVFGGGRRNTSTMVRLDNPGVLIKGGDANKNCLLVFYTKNENLEKIQRGSVFEFKNFESKIGFQFGIPTAYTDADIEGLENGALVVGSLHCQSWPRMSKFSVKDINKVFRGIVTID